MPEKPSNTMVTKALFCHNSILKEQFEVMSHKKWVTHPPSQPIWGSRKSLIRIYLFISFQFYLLSSQTTFTIRRLEVKLQYNLVCLSVIWSDIWTLASVCCSCVSYSLKEWKVSLLSGHLFSLFSKTTLERFGFSSAPNTKVRLSLLKLDKASAPIGTWECNFLDF